MKNSSNAARSCAFVACGSCAWVFGYCYIFAMIKIQGPQISLLQALYFAAEVGLLWSGPIDRFDQFFEHRSPAQIDNCPYLVNSWRSKRVLATFAAPMTLKRLKWVEDLRRLCFLQGLLRGSYRLLSIEYRHSGNVEKTQCYLQKSRISHDVQ